MIEFEFIFPNHSYIIGTGVYFLIVLIPLFSKRNKNIRNILFMKSIFWPIIFTVLIYFILGILKGITGWNL